MIQRHPHHEIIRSLGGKAEIARFLGLDPSSVTRWHERGIPPRYWLKIEEMATHKGVNLKAEELQRLVEAHAAQAA